MLGVSNCKHAVRLCITIATLLYMLLCNIFNFLRKNFKSGVDSRGENQVRGKFPPPPPFPGFL